MRCIIKRSFRTGKDDVKKITVDTESKQLRIHCVAKIVCQDIIDRFDAATQVARHSRDVIPRFAYSIRGSVIEVRGNGFGRVMHILGGSPFLSRELCKEILRFIKIEDQPVNHLSIGLFANTTIDQIVPEPMIDRERSGELESINKIIADVSRRLDALFDSGIRINSHAFKEMGLIVACLQKTTNRVEVEQKRYESMALALK